MYSIHLAWGWVVFINWIIFISHFFCVVCRINLLKHQLGCFTFCFFLRIAISLLNYNMMINLTLFLPTPTADWLFQETRMVKVGQWDSPWASSTTYRGAPTPWTWASSWSRPTVLPLMMMTATIWPSEQQQTETWWNDKTELSRFNPDQHWE